MKFMKQQSPSVGYWFLWELGKECLGRLPHLF